MKKLTLILSLFILFQACDSTSAMQEPEPPKPVQELTITHHVRSFVSDKKIRAFTNDSLIADTLDNVFDYETTVKVGDKIRTEVTYIERSISDVEISYTHNGDGIGGSCHAFPPYPAGATNDCGFTLTQELYDVVTK